MPSEFAYLLAKAQRYLKIGPDRYRRADAFNLPSQNLSPKTLDLVTLGMRQICQFLGYHEDRPFKDLGVGGFYALLETLHFGVVRQSARMAPDGSILDKMEMRHQVTNEEITLYNLVPPYVPPGD